MFACMLVFISKAADQIHEIKGKILKLVSSKTDRDSKKPDQ